MKKRLAIVLVMLLVLGLYVPSKVEAACNHSGGGQVQNQYISVYVSDGPSTHHNSMVYEMQCFTCFGYYDIVVPFSSESHTWSNWIVGSHLSNNTHNASKYCTKCSATQTQTYSCPGNPCRYPI